MRGLTIGLVGLLAGLGTVAAGGWIDTLILPGGERTTACDGGAVAVDVGGENDVWVTCAWSPDEHVICAAPGAVGWSPAPMDQVTVTCEAGPK